jgi:molecular chaperone GrpE
MTTNRKRKKAEAPADAADVDAPPADAPPADESLVCDEAGPKEESDSLAAPEDVEEDIEDVRLELENRLQRLQADFDNFRKRMLKERQEVYGRATESVMSDLLPVLDHLDLAIGAAESHAADERFLEGFQMVANQLTDTLGKLGLTSLTVEGELFDPNLHEAVSRMPSEFVDEGFVVKETRRGYTIGDRLLRPAQVIVSSGSTGDSG